MQVLEVYLKTESNNQYHSKSNLRSYKMINDSMGHFLTQSLMKVVQHFKHKAVVKLFVLKAEKNLV